MSIYENFEHAQNSALHELRTLVLICQPCLQLDCGMRFVDESLLSHAILGSLHIRTYTVHSTVLKFNERFSIYSQDQIKDGWVQEKCGRSTS